MWSHVHQDQIMKPIFLNKTGILQNRWQTQGGLLKLGSYDSPIDIELPTHVELEISNTEPGLKGDSVTGGNKPATLETGANIAVPLFINIGDIIKVDTRDGKYLERTKKA